MDSNSNLDVIEQIVRKELYKQMDKGFGQVQFVFQIRDGRVVHIKITEETSLKIGS